MYFLLFLGVLCLPLFWYALLCVHFSFAIILKRMRKLVALLILSYRCIVTINVLWLFLTVPCVGLQYVIVVFPDHTHLFFNRASPLDSLRSNYFIFVGYLKTGRGGEGSSEPPLDPPLSTAYPLSLISLRFRFEEPVGPCLSMERQAKTVTNCADSQADPSGTHTKVYLLPRREKTCLRGLLTYTIQTRALCYRDNDKLTHTCIRLASFFRDICKQCKPRSVATERGACSGSQLFAYRVFQ